MAPVHTAPSDGVDIWGMLRGGPAPYWLRAAAAIGWRILVLAGVIVVITTVISRFKLVLIPLGLAIMVAAALAPIANWLARHGWPRILATWAAFLAAAGIVLAVGFIVIPAIAAGLTEMGPSLEDGYQAIRTWLLDSSLGLNASDLDELEASAIEVAGNFLQSQAPSRAVFVLELLASLLLTMIVAFFYVKDGEKFTDRFLARAPADVRDRLASSFSEGWRILQRYLAALMVIGAVDALFIGLGLAFLGIPLVLPLALLTFVSASFPLVGAIFAGGVATLFALATGGPGAALAVLILTIVVQQLDGDIIAPAVFSRAIDLHPLTILVALTAGAITAGALGAFMAVPILAVSVTVVNEWRSSGEATSEPA